MNSSSSASWVFVSITSIDYLTALLILITKKKTSLSLLLLLLLFLTYFYIFIAILSICKEGTVLLYMIDEKRTLMNNSWSSPSLLAPSSSRSFVFVLLLTGVPTGSALIALCSALIPLSSTRTSPAVNKNMKKKRLQTELEQNR